MIFMAVRENEGFEVIEAIAEGLKARTIDVHPLILRGEGHAAIDKQPAPFAFDIEAIHAYLTKPSKWEQGERTLFFVFLHLESRAHRAEFFDHEVEEGAGVGREVARARIDDLEFAAVYPYVGEDADEPACDVGVRDEEARDEANACGGLDHLPHEAV